MFENPRRGKEARNFTKNIPKILDLKIVYWTDIFRKLTLGSPDLGDRRKWPFWRSGHCREVLNKSQYLWIFCSTGWKTGAVLERWPERETLVLAEVQLYINNTAKPCFMDTRLIWTPHHYGQLALSLGKESPCIFSKFNLLSTDTPLIWTLSMTPSVSVLTRFTVQNPYSQCRSRVPPKITLMNWLFEKWIW